MAAVKTINDLGPALEEDALEELYTWIDQIPLSRPKKNMARDFSDGVLVAEVIKHMFPRIVDVHNYTMANSTKQKITNWITLNKRVFCKLQFELSDQVVQDIVTTKPDAIERFLSILRTRLDRVQWETKSKPKPKPRVYENERPEADQNTFGQISSRKEPAGRPRGAPASMAVSMTYKGMKLPQDETVPLLLLEEKEQEVLAKNETIQILQAKVKRLEHLLHLKDIRIEELQNRLETVRSTGIKR